MSSPFESAQNATLFFEIPTAELESDRWGNPVPRSEPLVCKALLKRKKQPLKLSPLTEPMPGADWREGEFEGYLIDPLELPASIPDGAKAKATIRLSANLEVTGTFKLHFVVQNPFLIAAGITDLTPISGTFNW